MYSQVIDSTHFFIPKTELVLPIEELRDRFTVKSKFKDNEPIETFKETEKFFGVPRHYQNVGNITDQIVDARSEGEEIDFQFTSELRPRQIPVFEEFSEALKSGGTGFLVNLSTGGGKTVLSLKFLESLKTTTLIVVPRDHLVEQWRERILQHTNIKEGEIGIAQGPTCDYKGKKLVIGMIHSLSKDKYPMEFLKWPGAVVWDECIGGDHRVYTAEGSVSLRDLTVGTSILNHRGEYVTVLAKRVVKKEAIKLKFKSGKEFVCSPDHPVYTQLYKLHGGWKYGCEEAGKVKNFVFNTNTSYEQEFDREEYLAGLFLSDGHTPDRDGDRKIRFSFSGKKYKKNLILHLQRMFPDLVLTETINSRGDHGVKFPADFSKYFMEKWGLPSGAKSSLIKVPEAIYVKASSSFLRGFYDGDGYISHNDKGTNYIGLDSASPYITIQIKDMLARHGIFSRISVFTRPSEKHSDRNRILVSGESATKFAMKIGVPYGRIFLGGSYKKRDRGFVNDNVVSVESLGETELYDISISSEDELFLCDGYIVHNCHLLGAVTFSKCISMFPAKYRIGLSATMERTDGMSNVFKWAIGETLITWKGTTDVVPTVFIKQYKSNSKKREYLNKVTDVTRRCGIILSSIAEDTTRNQLIAHYAKKFADSGRKTLILSHRKEQLRSIHQILTGKLGYPFGDVGFFVGQTKKAEKQGILDNSRIILATYGVMSLGVDVPDLRALIYGTPQSEAEQSVGRILRMCEGAKDPVVLDIVDENYKECLRWEVKRRSMYTKNKAKIVFLNGEK